MIIPTYRKLYIRWTECVPSDVEIAPDCCREQCAEDHYFGSLIAAACGGRQAILLIIERDLFGCRFRHNA
jgi:hypothetical protein